MLPLAMLILSVVAQFFTAFLALFMIRKNRHVGAWSLVVAALFLMGARRIVVLADVVGGVATINPVAEVIALAISLLMLAGVWKLQSMFESLNRLRLEAEDQIEQRRKAEAELRASLIRAEEAAARMREREEQLRFLSDNLPGGLLYQLDCGVDGKERRFTYVSRGVEQLHELSVAEVMQSPDAIFMQLFAEDRAAFTAHEKAALTNMSLFNAEFRISLPSGKTKWILFASAPRRLPDSRLVWDGIELDITELRRMEDERQRMQTIESLGTVAGGIAHDFNNMLTSLFGNIELAQMELPPGHSAGAFLQVAHQAVERARQLTSRLLTFAKGGQPVLQTLDIRQRLRDTVRSNVTGSRVAVRFLVADDLWPVQADADQFVQVVVNLTVNAREAMPNGGSLTVQAQNVHDPGLISAPELHGDYVKISFADEGNGIPARIIDKIFDPYFSTKRTGVGLGLAITHGIVHKHKGHVLVESVPDQGTTFTVFFPAAASAPTPASADEQRPADGRPVPAPTPGARGHVLVMDDEESVRNVSARMLIRMGYTAETAVDGREAIDKYEAAMQSPKPFDLTIMDLTVPGGMGGEEAVRKLLAIDPTARVIVVSGYSSDTVLAEYARYGFAGCLTKPYEMQALKETVARLLKAG
jgi:signal transduction histidine kinase/ActR/RegA family two-component response regulator